MWAIRILSGPQAGQIFPLKPGKNVMGRGPACEVKVASTGVSKEHAQIFVTEDKVIVSDLNSSNGTFINGVRVQNQKLVPGDKLVLHEIIFDIVALPAGATIVPMAQARGYGHGSQHGSQGDPHPMQYPQGWPGGGATAPRMEFPQGMPDMNADVMMSEAAGGPEPARLGFVETIINYFENVAMPGLYNFAQMFEYRWVLAGMVAVYIFLVTAVAVIPTITMIKSSVEEESRRRAITISRNLAARNASAIKQKNEMAVDVSDAGREDGVAAAIVINAKDGAIIAPSNLRGSYSEKTFVIKARKTNGELVQRIDSSTLGSSTPIMAYDSETSSQSPAAYAIVIYDMSDIATQDGRMFGLFLQILGIAGVLGLILFVFIIRVIEHPLVQLNAQLDDALREGRDELQTSYKFPRLEQLASNISSALARIGQSNGNADQISVNRDAEAMNLVGMVGTAAVAINGLDERIIVSNGRFDSLIGGGVDLRGRGINDIPDSSLQLNLREMLPRLRAQPDQPSVGEIPFLGQPHEIRAQAIVANDGSPSYYLVTIRPAGEEGYS